MTKTLVLIEHDRERVKRPSLHAVTAAEGLGGGYALLVIGSNVDEIAASVACYGAAAVFAFDDSQLADPLAGRYAKAITHLAESRGFNTIVGASSTFTKDVLPRVAALLDAPMLSDVVSIDQNEGSTVYRRPIHAGSAIATVKLDSDVRVLTIRPSGFETPRPRAVSCSVQKLKPPPASLADGMRFVSREDRQSDRPDLSEARVVVGGGRPLKDTPTFERFIGGLADVLGGTTGATRAAVDAGIAPNDWQIGQTGKVIAPDLYVAVGVSGAVQHLAGIKDSRVIVAINKDPQAPIFQMATYGMIGDLYEIVPELIQALGRS